MHARALLDRARRTQKESLWLAWHVAALSNARQLPTLAALMQDHDAPPVDAADAPTTRDAAEQELARIVAEFEQARKVS